MRRTASPANPRSRSRRYTHPAVRGLFRPGDAGTAGRKAGEKKSSRPNEALARRWFLPPPAWSPPSTALSPSPACRCRPGGRTPTSPTDPRIDCRSFASGVANRGGEEVRDPLLPSFPSLEDEALLTQIEYLLPSKWIPCLEFSEVSERLHGSLFLEWICVA